MLLWAAFVMLLTCIPYVYALKLADGRTFGGFIWGVDEGNVYLTWMRQASEGEVLLRNQYTPSPEKPRFFNVFLQLGGRAGRLLHVDMKTMFHLLRLLGGFLTLVVFYLLMAELTADRVARWAALGLASLGSGLGWLIVLVYPQSGLHPVDVGQAWQIQPEAVTFSCLLINGLFATSLGLMCLTFLFAVRAIRDCDTKSAVWAGLTLMVLGNVHTYDVFAVWLALGLWSLAAEMVDRPRTGRRVGRAGLIVLISLPQIAWSLYATFTDPAFLAKGLTPTPAFRFVDYVVAYGLIGLLALIGAVLSFSRHPAIPPSRLPVFWTLGNSLVLFLPISFQRKMIEGLHLALCILAGFAVSWLAYAITRGLRARGKHKHAMERIVLTVCAVVVLCLPSNALLVSECLQNVKTNTVEFLQVLLPPIYLDAPDAQAMQWLRTHTQPEDLIVSTSLMGTYLPTYCPAKVWIGHWAETLNFREQLRALRSVYAPMTGETLRRELQNRGITMVYFGPYEQAMTGTDLDEVGAAEAAPRWLQAADSALQRVYEEQGVRIYRVPPVSP